MPKRATDVPDDDYELAFQSQWISVKDGKAYLVQRYVVSAGKYIGTPVKIRLPITDITGTVEFD